MNFPPKNQGADNTVSIFHEENFQYTDSEYFLLKLREEKDCQKPKIFKISFFDQKNEKRRNSNRILKRASSLQNEDDELKRTSSPSPRLKSILQMKNHANLKLAAKFSQILEFWREKKSIDLINYKLSCQNITGIFANYLTVSLNNSHILTFIKSERDEAERVNIICMNF